MAIALLASLVLQTSHNEYNFKFLFLRSVCFSCHVFELIITSCGCWYGCSEQWSDFDVKFSPGDVNFPGTKVPISLLNGIYRATRREILNWSSNYDRKSVEACAGGILPTMIGYKSFLGSSPTDISSCRPLKIT